MEILYLISVIVLFVFFILVRKAENRIDIVGFISISAVLLLCYNTFVCYVLTFFTIPCEFWILSLINLVICVCLGINIFKDKKIQRYYFNKIDILYIALIIIVILAIAFVYFGFPFDVNYVSSDSTVHYLGSVMFAEQHTLMPNTEPDLVYGKLTTFKPASYTNSGLLMRCLGNNEPIEYYNTFVIFGFFVLVLIGTTIYGALKKYAQKKEHVFWAFLISIICVCGYPLNSWIFGFEYLTLGLLILCAIIDFIYYYENEILSSFYYILFFGLLNFGLFCSYYMFVPFTYSALWIYFGINNYNATKKIFNTKILTMWFVTLIVPFILGYIYTLAPAIYSIVINRGIYLEELMNVANGILNKGFPLEGFIYINVYSNMLLLLPLPIYLFIKEFKEKNLKKNIFLFIILFFTIIFIAVLLIGNKFGKVSMYYLSKNYFALWIILAFANYIALIKLSKEGNYLPRLLISLYIFFMTIYIPFTDIYLKQSNINEKENIFSFMEVFVANKTTINKKTKDLNQQELEIIKFANDNLNLNSNFEVVSSHRAYYWVYVLLRDIDKKDDIYMKNSKLYLGQGLIEAKSFNLVEKLKNKESLEYLIYFYRNDRYNKVKDIIYENAEIIYENEAGGILRYNK